MAKTKSKLMDEWKLINIPAANCTDSIEYPELDDDFWNKTEAEYADKSSVSRIPFNSNNLSCITQVKGS